LTITTTDAAGNMSTTNLSVVQSSVALTVAPLNQEQMKYAHAWVSGTVDDPDCTITVNGVEGVNYGTGSWAADNVPLAPGGTVTLQVVAQLSGGETVQTLLEQEREPIVFTQTYGYNLDYSTLIWTYGETNASDTHHIAVHWERGLGGTNVQTSSWVDFDTGDVTSNLTVTVWPADNGYLPSLCGQQVTYGYLNGDLISTYTNSEDPPNVEWLEESATAGSLPADFAVSYSECSGREVRLFTGGKAARQNQGMFDLTAALTVESELDLNVIDWVYHYQGFSAFLQPAEPPVAVPSEQISLGGLGNLDADGHLWTLQPDGAEPIITPKVVAPISYSFHASAAPRTSDKGLQASSQKYKLLVTCVSPCPTNTHRLVIGVGEEVNISVYPSLSPPEDTQVTWKTTAGSRSPWYGNTTKLTAPSNACTASVTMGYKALRYTTNFNVVEPQNVVRAVTVARKFYEIGQAGAGMHITPYVGPTNVSFYRVQLMEVGQPATGISGYFLNNPPPPHDYIHLADHFDIQLGYDNSWPGGYDWATSPVFLPQWSVGQFTWHIPAKWKIGSGPTNDLAGSWDQVFTLAPDGTVTVTKFGHTVTRHTSENYGVVVPTP
jgi:hypothetical protein